MLVGAEFPSRAQKGRPAQGGRAREITNSPRRLRCSLRPSRATFASGKGGREFRPHPGAASPEQVAGDRRCCCRGRAGVLSAGTDLAAGLFLPISPMRSTFPAATFKPLRCAPSPDQYGEC